jgi:hypothetical protein
MKPKLTKKTVAEIQSAIDSLNTGIGFILAQKTYIVRETSLASFPADTWTSGIGIKGIAITKEIGSELCGVFNARSKLQQMITPVLTEEIPCA